MPLFVGHCRLPPRLVEVSNIRPAVYIYIYIYIYIRPAGMASANIMPKKNSPGLAVGRRRRHVTERAACEYPINTRNRVEARCAVPVPTESMALAAPCGRPWCQNI